MALVQRYGSIDEIYRLLPDIEAKPAAIRKLQAGEDAARHSYWLATIMTDAPLAFDPAENVRRPFRPELYDLLLKLEFQKLIDRYGLRPAAQTEEKPDCTATAEELLTAAQAEEFLALWRAADCVAVYALPDLSALAVECEAADGSRAAELYADRYEGDWQALLTALFSGDIKKAAHNVKDLMAALLAQGLPIEGFVFDTALAAYLLDATAGSYDLQRLFVAYYNEELPRPVHLEPDAFSMLGDHAAAAAAFLSPVLPAFWSFARRFSTTSRSLRMSSVSMVSMSRTGSTLPSTWTMSVPSKQRTTCTMASHSRMFPRNLLPRPSPFDAPFTRPAMSTNSTMAGVFLFVSQISASLSRRASGTGTTPTFGSMVQNG